MFKRVFCVLTFIIGLSFGYTIGPFLWEAMSINQSFINHPLVNGVIFGILFMFLGLIIYPFIEKLIRGLIEIVNKQTTLHLLLGTIGILIGILLGYLVALPFTYLGIPFLSSILPLILSLIFAMIGYQIVISRKEEWLKFMQRPQTGHRQLEQKHSPEINQNNFQQFKLLDTSVIIDGRIADIVKTNFIEGTLIIPNFVLQELQYIADSSDSLKRAKGRRGLDILNTLQKDGQVPIEFYEGDIEETTEVDGKLVRLAKIMGAAIVTNDFNLNKVCEFQNIAVFNINELANALKPVVIPGEELEIQVIKPGTERKQGVAYLEDGTMIVVEDGQNYMNEWITVVVTSALQTAAGRMIFAKPIEISQAFENHVVVE